MEVCGSGPEDGETLSQFSANSVVEELVKVKLYAELNS